VLTVIQARLTLNESVPPTLSASGGALLGAGPKSGVLPLSYGAADADSGVASVTVSLDATVAGTTTYPCPHDGWNACPLSPGTDVVQVDTTKVPDGPHAVVVTVRDAANNAVTRSVGAITVSNPAGPGPVVLGGPNGTTASRLAKLTVAYTTTRKRSRTLHIGSRPTIRGTLVDEHGAAITAARIAILQRLRQTGASTTQVATVQTGADGGFSYKLDGGPSRTITAAYTAFGGDPKPATSAALLTNVRAIVTGSIRARARG